MKLTEILQPTLNWDLSRTMKLIPIQVNISDLWNKIDPDWLVTNTSTVNRIGNRFERAVDHFQKGLPMNVPIIGYNKYDPKYPISFTDGRHRTAAAFELGVRKIPVLVEPGQLEDIKRILRVK